MRFKGVAKVGGIDSRRSWYRWLLGGHWNDLDRIDYRCIGRLKKGPLGGLRVGRLARLVLLDVEKLLGRWIDGLLGNGRDLPCWEKES